MTTTLRLPTENIICDKTILDFYNNYKICKWCDEPKLQHISLMDTGSKCLECKEKMKSVYYTRQRTKMGKLPKIKGGCFKCKCEITELNKSSSKSYCKPCWSKYYREYRTNKKMKL